jgi:uncharacterized protein (DUF697 family)
MEPQEMEVQEMIIEPKEVSKTEVDKIIRHHIWGAMGVGLIPAPLFDLVALAGVQVNLLRNLAKVYGIPFFKDTAKNILSSLVGGALPVAVAPGLAASITKVIPGFGQTIGVITMPIVAGASTYAVGKVFTQHFASGGTFLSFDPEKVKDYYAEMFKEGEKVVAKMKKDIFEGQPESEAETRPAPETETRLESQPESEPESEADIPEKKEGSKAKKKGIPFKKS